MLTFIRTDEIDARKGLYECECGVTKVIWKTNVYTQHTTSCGCIRRKTSKQRFTTHGHKANRQGSRTYVVWTNMKARCRNPTARLYARYGGRGIGYIPKWEQFEMFLQDMGEAPDGLTIDRIDNDQDYSKDNCRWATRVEQAQNKSNVTLYEYDGQTRSVADWARVTGIGRLTLRYRLNNGWPVERALRERPK